MESGAMTSDSFDKIQEAIRAAIDGAPGRCATLSLAGNPARWLQVADDTVNAAYPLVEDPEGVLGLLPAVDGLSVSEWEAGRFCTVQVEDLADPALVRWIDGYFVAVFAAESGRYELELRVEEL